MSFVIAVDGTAASGKGTISQKLAERYELDYLDTGVLYRGVGMIAHREFGTVNNHEAAIKAAQAFADGYPDIINGLNLRSDLAGRNASIVSKIPKVRDILFQMQRDFGLKASKGAVIDGRDIGSVIFPEAPVKLFFDADLVVRTQRRLKDLRNIDNYLTFEQLLQDMRDRDDRDKNRPVAPLKAMPDSILVDSTTMNVEQVLSYVTLRVDPIVEKFFK